MSKGEELLRSVLSEAENLLKNKWNDRVYKDEPILKTAAQMLGRLPAKYRQMRNLVPSSEAYRQSDRWLFYQQGKFMEDFTDTFEEPVEFWRYFPTYQAMNDRQLRGYFAWRTKVRQGNIEPTALSFVFVYLYELLHEIGVASPEEGFHTLYEFWQTYRTVNAQIDRYVKQWLFDYVVYYGLEPARLSSFADTQKDEALWVLLNFSKQEAGDIFKALVTLSTYNIAHSKLYKQFPEEVEQVVYRVFARLIPYYEKKRKNTLWEKLFGKKVVTDYYMFDSAVFYDRMKYESYEYIVNPIHHYRCHHGKWQCERYHGNRTANKLLGSILKTIDNCLRSGRGLPLLKEEEPPKYLLQIIKEELAALEEEKRQAEKRVIHLDLSKLQDIRRAADSTRDKLIVEEESEEVLPPLPEEPLTTPTETYGLDDIQFAFLRCLLQGDEYAVLLRENGKMVSVVVDGINEALFDHFGDTVLLFDGAAPEVLEDYADELKGMMGL